MSKVSRTANDTLIRQWQTAICNHRTISRDVMTPSALDLMKHTLDVPMQTISPGTVVPATWHHIYFPPRTPEQDLAKDGYETDFFPPPPFAQRLWAGATYTWSPNTLRVGDEATLTTSVDNIELRSSGRLGDTVFVRLNKEISNERGWSMCEQRTLAYTTTQPSSIASRILKVNRTPQFSTTLQPSPILLFRYSALTFNSHLIHYDHDYATKVEGHPACLVHGPLSATLLMGLMRSHLAKETKEFNESCFKSFQYTCVAPLYVNQTLTVCGRLASENAAERVYDVWITNDQHHLAVKGSVTVKQAP